MRHLILLPDLGQTTSEATVLQWLKQIGQKVSRGEPLLVVQTDKVDMDVESFVDGYLREVLVAEGTIATALKPVAILTDAAEEDYERLTDAPRVAYASVAKPAGSSTIEPAPAVIAPRAVKVDRSRETEVPAELTDERRMRSCAECFDAAYLRTGCIFCSCRAACPARFIRRRARKPARWAFAPHSRKGT